MCSLIPIIASVAPPIHKALYFEWRDKRTVTDSKWKRILNGWGTTGEISPHKQKEEKMESPYPANLDVEHTEEKNYAMDHPEIVINLVELIKRWEEDVFLHTSGED